MVTGSRGVPEGRDRIGLQTGRRGCFPKRILSKISSNLSYIRPEFDYDEHYMVSFVSVRLSVCVN